MKIKYTILVLVIISIFYTSCTTTGGANWMLVDFNKQNNNYRDLENFTSQISVGMSKDQVLYKFNPFVQVVEATKEYETLAVDQWDAAVGNDCIVKVLYIKIENNILTEYRIQTIPSQRITIPVYIWK